MYLEGPNGGIALPEGETTDSVFKDKKAFEIYSFSFGASNPVTLGSGTGGGGAGKVSISSFNIMKRTDKASPKLFAACCAGGHFNKAIVSLRKAGPESAKAGGVYLEYTFHKVFIESIQWSGSAGGDDYPTESVSFGFGAIEIGYKPQKPDGTLDTKVPATWSVIKNDNTTNVA
jgi:type VI secretion system secreted protein Hcp